MRRFPWVAAFVLVAGRAGAQIPAGTEFRANSYTTGTQRIPAVASDANGKFVVVWSSMGQDGDGYGIFGRRFAWPGTPLSSDFQVNTTTFGHQQNVAVTSDAAGNFVVAWADINIHARRFTALGAPFGADFVVNTYTTSFRNSPDVAMAPDGRFVVTWSSNLQDGDAFGIFAQRFDASGAPQGPEFRVNAVTTGGQGRSAVAIDRSGNFVVVWTSSDGSTAGISGQRFNAAGAAQGTQFRVNTHTTGYQGNPDVAMDVDGNFVVAWDDDSAYDGAEFGVFARRFDAAGVALGAQFRVNTHTPSRQLQPAVAAAADGSFSIVWQSPHDGSASGIFGQLYSAAGAPVGGEFQVNTYTTFDQQVPAITATPDGDLVVAWHSIGQDAGSYGIYGQRFGDLIFQDGFETGGTGNWSSASLDGDLSVFGPAALASTTYGLQAVVNDQNALFVRDDTPNNESSYRARFYFDPNSFDPGEASGHLRMRLCIVHNAANQRLVTIVLRRQGGAYSIAARGRRDDGTRVATVFVPITNAPHHIEFDWRRSTPGNNNGFLYLYVDGFMLGEVDFIDNDASGVDYVRLGAMTVKTGASGTLLFDQFESRRVRYIGPEL